MSNTDKLGQTMLNIFSICGVDEETTAKLLGIMAEELQKENKEMEIQNQAKMLAGHDKELQNGIVMLMKEYGLGSSEAYELIHRLSNAGNVKTLIDDECDEVKSYRKFTAKPKFKVFADLTDEQKEEMKNIKDPVQILTEAAAKVPAPIYETVQESGIDDVMQDVYASGNITGVYDENNKPPTMPVESKSYEEVVKECKQLKSELRDIERYVYKFFDNSYTSVEYERQPHTSDEFDAIVKRLLELSGWADKKEYTSGEDPGDENEIIVPLTPVKNNVFAGSEEKEELLTINERNDKIREYQRTAFGEMNITFKDGDEYICSLDIHDVLERCMYVLRGQHIILPYKLKNTVRRYEIVESVPKKFPSHELLIQVKEIKAYD